jgi:hypothetical protein
MGTTVFETISEEFGRLIQHQTVQQKLEENPVTVEEMFSLEQKPFRLSKPAYGSRASGGSVGSADQVKRPAQKVTPQEVQKHQDHEAQQCAFPGCRLCDDPNYKWSDRPGVGKKHSFPKNYDSALEARGGQELQNVYVSLVHSDKQIFAGCYEKDRIVLVRHLACTLSPRVKGRYKDYVIPDNMKPLVSALTASLVKYLTERGVECS